MFLHTPELPASLVISSVADPFARAPVLAAVESGSRWPVEVLVVDAEH